MAKHIVGCLEKVSGHVTKLSQNNLEVKTLEQLTAGFISVHL